MVGELGRGWRARRGLPAPRRCARCRRTRRLALCARRASRARARGRTRSGRVSSPRGPGPPRRLLQRLDEPLHRLVEQRLEQLRGRTRARPRSPAVSDLVGRLAKLREPARDHLLDALGHARARAPRSSSSMKNGLPSVSSVSAGRTAT